MAAYLTLFALLTGVLFALALFFATGGLIILASLALGYIQNKLVEYSIGEFCNVN